MPTRYEDLGIKKAVPQYHLVGRQAIYNNTNAKLQIMVSTMVEFQQTATRGPNLKLFAGEGW